MVEEPVFFKKKLNDVLRGKPEFNKLEGKIGRSKMQELLLTYSILKAKSIRIKDPSLAAQIFKKEAEKAGLPEVSPEAYGKSAGADLIRDEIRVILKLAQNLKPDKIKVMTGADMSTNINNMVKAFLEGEEKSLIQKLSREEQKNIRKSKKHPSTLDILSGIAEHLMRVQKGKEKAP